MESISKTPIDRSTAQAIVTEALGPVTVTAFDELTEGWFNAAYAIGLDDGHRVVLKVAPPPEVEVLAYEHDLVHAEIDALELIRSRTDAPVPAVLWVDDRCRHAPSPLFVMTHVAGRSLSEIGGELTPDDRAGVDAELGRHLRAINDITGTDFGLLSPSAARFATWTEAFTTLFESVIADGERRSVELPVRYDDLRSVVTDAGPALGEVTEPHLVYWDLWDGNVLVDTATHRLAGMLDLERAMWGDPLIEGQFGPHGHSPALLDAYGSIDTTSAGAVQRRALYTLHLHLVMSVEGTYRQYPEDPLGDWARTQLADDLDRCHRA